MFNASPKSVLHFWHRITARFHVWASSPEEKEENFHESENVGVSASQLPLVRLELRLCGLPSKRGLRRFRFGAIP